MISVDGIDVSFWERGARGNHALILIHGLGDCARSWDYFAQAMADRFRVISLDSRGHGESDKSLGEKYSLDDYERDVQILVEKLELGSLILVGHGNGGRIALSYTHNNPDKIRGLVIADSNIEPKDGSSRFFPLDIKDI